MKEASPSPITMPFRTSETTNSTGPRHGRRKIPPAAKAVQLRWPEDQKEARRLFDIWHQIASQVLQRQRQSFVLICMIQHFINWRSGELWPTNRTIAERAGGFSESTIKRQIRAYEKLGLIVSELGCRRQKDGQLVRKRTIRLAIPEGFEGRFGDPSERVNRGPDGDYCEGVICGPLDGVNRGPDTFEDL